MVKQEGPSVRPRTMLAWLLLALSLLHFVAAARQATRYGFADLPIFLQRTAEFDERGELYPDPDHPTAYDPAAPVYKFPPLFAVLLLPEVRLDLGEAVYGLHVFAQALLYLGSVWLLALALRERAGPAFGFWLAVLALNFVPYVETLWRLQLETPILFLVCLALWAESRGRGYLAGAAVGAAAMLKIYPVFLLGWFVLRRSVRGLAGAAVAMVALFALGWFVIGAEQNTVFFTRILPKLMQETPILSGENVSLAKTLAFTVGLGGEVGKRVAQLLSLLLVAAGYLALHGRPYSANRPIDASALLALMVPAMLLFMPNAWTNYLLLLLVPFAWLLALATRDGGRRGVALAGLALGFALTTFFTPCGPPETGWPCAQTPRWLALVALPRTFHDFMVACKPLIVPWVGVALLLTFRGGPALSRAASGATGSRESSAAPGS